jgi:hypothetical protein
VHRCRRADASVAPLLVRGHLARIVILLGVGDDLTRAWLAHYGAPLWGAGAVLGRAAPELEVVVVDGLGLSRRDASLTRALPVLLWLRRGDLDMRKLHRLAAKKRRERTLGFFLDVAAQLSGDRRLRDAASALRRPAPSGRMTDFFTRHQSALARARAEENTPPVARSWGYRMNMGIDAFESMFAKVKAIQSGAVHRLGTSRWRSLNKHRPSQEPGDANEIIGKR